MTAEPLPDELDSLHVEAADVATVVHALRATCEAEGLRPAAIAGLPPPGSFVHGEEDPAIRRFLVGAPVGRWVTVLMSARDWEHAFAPRLTGALGCRAAHLMLHDGDTCTLHVLDGAEVLAALCTSPCHFDRPGEPRDPRLRGGLAALAGRSLTEQEVEWACSPPGRIDVDGRLAFARLVALLDLPARALTSYAMELRRLDGAASEAGGPGGWTHVAFARAASGTRAGGASGPHQGGGRASRSETGRVVPFRPGGPRPRGRGRQPSTPEETPGGSPGVVRKNQGPPLAVASRRGG